MQLILLWIAAAVFLVGLPLLAGKRTFCGMICPFGAWQAFFGRLNPFRVSVDESHCIKCGKCAKACPVFAIQDGKDGFPEINSYCNRCAACMDACPERGIDYTIMGRKTAAAGSENVPSARVLFLFCALLIGGMMGMLFVPSAINELCQKLLRFF